MFGQKIIKYRKLIICVIVGVMIAGLIFVRLHTGSGTITTVPIPKEIGYAWIKHAEVIDQNLVIKSLNKVQQIVGFEGHVEKVYTYSDSMFKNHGWLKDIVGQRSLTMDAHGYFKLGIDISFTQDDIKAYGNTLFVKLPKEVLISMDVPFDQIIYKSKTGLIRNELSIPEKQYLYSEVRRIITDNIMNDRNIQEKALNGTKDAIKSLLENVPNCNRIIFTTK